MKRRTLSWILAVGLVAPAAWAHRTAEPAPSPAEVTPLLIGSKAPTPPVSDAGGAPFDLGAALGKKPTVLILYRGGW